MLWVFVLHSSVRAVLYSSYISYALIVALLHALGQADAEKQYRIITSSAGFSAVVILNWSGRDASRYQIVDIIPANDQRTNTHVISIHG